MRLRSPSNVFGGSPFRYRYPFGTSSSSSSSSSSSPSVKGSSPVLRGRRNPRPCSVLDDLGLGSVVRLGSSSSLSSSVESAASVATRVPCNRVIDIRSPEFDKASMSMPSSGQFLSFREVHAGRIVSHVFSLRRISNQTPKALATGSFVHK